MARRRGGRWLQAARESMEKRGTVGAFGKATPKKIARGLREGGIQAKRAQFAKNMKAMAARRRHRGSRR